MIENDDTRRCSECGNKYPRSLLVVKRVVFDTMGVKYKRLKSRTVAWLCPTCLSADSAWNQKKHVEAPGVK